MITHLDFETYCDLDIKKVGAAKYCAHPSFEILMLGYTTPEGNYKVWVPDWYGSFHNATGTEEEILQALNSTVIVAHNAPFEQGCFKAAEKLLGWPAIPPSKFFCTAVLAASLALPRNLEGVATALQLSVNKDPEGKRLIKKFCCPQKPTKKQPNTRILPSDQPEEFEKFIAYCLDDVRTEHSVYNALNRYAPHAIEKEYWLADNRINNRGVPIDVDTAKKCLKIIDAYAKAQSSRFKELTGFNPTQTAKLLEWINQYRPFDNLQSATIDAALSAPDLPEVIKEPLQIRRSISRSSTKKIKAMLDTAMDDNRVRGALLFHGANTGRWAGRLIQPQNFPRPTLKNIEGILELIRFEGATYQDLELTFGDPLECISSILRSLICAPEGKEFVVADYTGIEPRVLCWLAGQEDVLELYKDPSFDPYIDMAAYVYDIPTGEVTSDQRALGKAIILGCGYGMGFKTFMATCEAWGIPITEALARKAVEGFRSRYDKVKSYWSRIGNAALKLAGEPSGFSYPVGKVEVQRRGAFLFIELPTGRRLSYPFVKVTKRKAPWGDLMDAVTFYGKQEGTVHWGDQSTYGGKLCLAKGAQVLSRNGWALIETIKPGTEVWDGEDWVTCDGHVCNGVGETISINGVSMTPDHEVLTNEGWKTASQSSRHNRLESRLPSSNRIRWEQWEEIPLVGEVRLRESNHHGLFRVKETGKERRQSVLRVQEDRNHEGEKNRSRYVGASRFCRMAKHARSLQTPFSSSLGELRREGDNSLRRMAISVPELLGGYGANLPERTNTGQDRQRRELLQRELPLGNLRSSGKQPKRKYSHKWGDSETSIRKDRGCPLHNTLPPRSWLPIRQDRNAPQSRAQLFDLVNCGPNNRFVVKDSEGFPLIVHNCENICQAVARDLMCNGIVEAEEAGYPVILTVHDELISEVEVGYGSVKEFEKTICKLPAWAEGIPLKAEGYRAKRYRK